MLVVFGFLGVGAVLIFSGLIPIGVDPAKQFGGRVTLWGTLPEQQVIQFFTEYNSERTEQFAVDYVEKKPETFQQELISALASDKGPDLVIFPQELIVSDEDKFAVLPYESISERLFRDSYADIGALYLGSSGVLGLPLYIDPLVMYWNRDLLASAGIAEPPRTWEQFAPTVEKLTKRDERGNITQSAVALGGVKNISNLKEVLSALIMQVGDPIVTRNAEGIIEPVLGGSLNQESPASAAVRFYTEFSNPARTTYSWNSSLSEAKTFFEAGTLAMYFGPASAGKDIALKNPHLNFDVAQLPQRERATSKITFGRLYGVGVLKSGANVPTAFRAAIDLTTPEVSRKLSEITGLPSARRSVLSARPKDPLLDVFNRSAIISRGWFDPRDTETKAIFAEMVESVIINKTNEQEAVSEARSKLDALFRRR